MMMSMIVFFLLVLVGGSNNPEIVSFDVLHISAQYPLPPSNQKTTSPAHHTCKTDPTWSDKQKCVYFEDNVDACEGGGQVKWTSIVGCQTTAAGKALAILGAVGYFVIMLLFVLTTADKFFSPNIVGIVKHWRMKDSIAGVTLMALGNGSPDIFASVASVLSTSSPKAGMALGELLGGGLFVSSIVVSAIILVKPFKIDRFGTTRDVVFYLIAVGWLLFTFLYAEQVFVFEPAVFLVLYVLYVVTVVVVQGIFYPRIKNKVKNSRRAEAENVQNQENQETETQTQDDSDGQMEPAEDGTNNDGFVEDCVSVTSEMKEGSSPDLNVCSEDEEDTLETILGVIEGSESSETCSVKQTDREDGESSSCEWKALWTEIVDHMNVFPNKDSWNKMGLLKKLHRILTMPATFLLKLTVPHCEDRWSKGVLMLRILMIPQLILFATGLFSKFFALCLIASSIIMLLLFIFSEQNSTFKYFQLLCTYIGFFISILWIYTCSTEVVGVVTMFGNITGASHEILGLTLLAWSNSLGDLVADPAVARKGMPRMALGAAIGGPLFNLMVGFGIPFTIATARGTSVPIIFSATCRLLIVFLLLSLGSTLLLIFIQRFTLTKYHAYVLIANYLIFILFIILLEANVINWGP